MIDCASTVRPLTNSRVKVVDQEKSRLTLLNPFTAFGIRGQHHLAGLTSSITLQIGRVDRNDVNAPLHEMSSCLKTFPVARATENSKNQGPVIDAGKIEYEMLIDCESKPLWYVDMPGRRRLLGTYGHQSILSVGVGRRLRGISNSSKAAKQKRNDLIHVVSCK
jgi:hypothetical protein